MKKGFTLIELLVVVSIIALLASFLLPGLSRAREYAYFTTCKNSLRQVGIGFSIYAGDNNGRMPEAMARCGEIGGGNPSNVRIGSYGTQWIVAHGFTGESFVVEIYDGIMDRNPGSGGPVDPQVGPKGQRGKYLPIEALWDPIMKVKDWAPWGSSGTNGCGSHTARAGNECCRDTLARGRGLFGYEFFIHSVGCIKAQRGEDFTHVFRKYGGTYSDGVWNCQEPVRWHTKSRAVRTSNKPSVWLAACQTPILSYNNVNRTYISHFGLRQTVIGSYRFNVVHMDGHVHDDIWREKRINNQWAIKDNGNNNHTRPYGWEWVGGTLSHDGLETESYMDGAFDEN
jgi:prepilin-type N-terminal cleavage/methylation domain-containing protein